MQFSTGVFVKATTICGVFSIAHGQSSLASLWPTHTYKTHPTFTPPSLAINKTGGPLASGYLFFAPEGPAPLESAPLIMTDDNDLVWNGKPGHGFNFGVQEYQGKPVLTYWNGTVFHEPVGRGYGIVNILDASYSSIATVTLPGKFLVLAPGVSFPSNIDLHEINITPQGTLLVTANNVTTTDLTYLGGPAVGWVVDSLIYEIDIASNDVLFSWSALDHLKAIPLTKSLYPLGFEGFSGVNQSVAWGYSHINSVARYKDGYILSFRYLCEAVALDGKGNILWQLQGQNGGDFTLDQGTSFCFQHDIRPVHITSDSVVITMHDNANSPVNAANSKTPTSGLVLNVNLTNKVVSLNQRFQNPANPLYATAQGSFQQLLNNSIFMGHGFVPIFEEFAPDGAISMTAQFAHNTPGDGLSYRAFRQPWVGCPSTPPIAFTEIENGELAVYMSWNGATEYRAWVAFGGPAPDKLSIIARARRTGFETKVMVSADVKFVQVQALGLEGRDRCGKRGKNLSIVYEV